MKIVARPHTAPQPIEPPPEVYLEQRGDHVRVMIEANPPWVACTVALDDNREPVVLSSFSPPKVPQGIDALRPVMEAIEETFARRERTLCNIGAPICIGAGQTTEGQASSAVAAWRSLIGAPERGPLESGDFEPKRITVRMTDKAPDRPGLWLRKCTQGNVELCPVKATHRGLSMHGYILSSYTGPWSEMPLEPLEIVMETEAKNV